MKQIMISIAAMLMLSTAAMAQDNQGQRPNRQGFDRTEMIQRRTDGVVQKYGLNEEQAKQLLSLNTKYADQMGPRGMGMGMGRGGQGGRRGGQGMGPGMAPGQRPQMSDSLRQQMAEQQKAYEEELQKIMTPEQYKNYQADQEQRRQQFGGQRGPRGQRGQRPNRE